MRDPRRRRFSNRERKALYKAAGGRCEQCGDKLRRGWHADHVHPYSKGGETDVLNGAALCPTCNLKKSDTTTAERQKEETMTTTTVEDPRSVWQNAAVQKFLQGSGDFLVSAFPGTGKTRFTLHAIKGMLERKDIKRVVIVVPTRALCAHWNEDAARFGLDITNEYENSDDEWPEFGHGMVVTYQAMAMAADEWRKNIKKHGPTLVVFDEVHHVGEGKAWGHHIPHACESSVRRLSLSGTPFRVDGYRIPFLTYNDEGYVVPDFDVAYIDALSAKMIRPIRFVRFDGQAVVDRADGSKVIDRKRLVDARNEWELSKTWEALCDPHGDTVPTLFKDANDELSRQRLRMPDAAGIIHARSKRHADEYAKIMHRICGEAPVVVHDDIPNAHQIIEEFGRSDKRWLIAVMMVSEGIDIPRALVSVYLSDIIHAVAMWFLQVLARIIRKRTQNDSAIATMFIPEIDAITVIAERLEEEIRIALSGDDPPEWPRTKGPDEPVPDFGSLLLFDSSEVIQTGVTFAGDTIEQDEIALAEMVRQRNDQLLPFHADQIVLAAREMAAMQSQGEPVVFHAPSDEYVNPTKERKKNRDAVRGLVIAYANAANIRDKKGKLCPGIVWNDLYRRCGLKKGYELKNSDTELLAKMHDMLVDMWQELKSGKR